MPNNKIRKHNKYIDLNGYMLYGSNTLDVGYIKRLKGYPLLYLSKEYKELEDDECVNHLNKILKCEEGYINLYKIVGSNISYDYGEALGIKGSCKIHSDEEYNKYSKEYFNTLKDSVKSIFKRLNNKYIIICKK